MFFFNINVIIHVGSFLMGTRILCEINKKRWCFSDGVAFSTMGLCLITMSTITFSFKKKIPSLFFSFYLEDLQALVNLFLFF